MGGLPKGRTNNPKGRPIGAVNKLTTSMKDCTQQTLEWLQTQPRSNMREWAKENPTEFYRIAAKLIPTQLNAEVTNKVIKVIRADRGNTDHITDIT